MGTFVSHHNCERCGSSDANALYEDGTTFCWSCGAYGGSASISNFKETMTHDKSVGKSWKPLQGTYADIPNRGIRETVCRKYGYTQGTTTDGKPCHIADHRDASGLLVAQKLRLPNKHFTWLGERSSCLPLWGQHLWASSGKSVVITEGELDCLSVAQALGGGKWPVVSLPDGAQAAPRAIKQAYEWLCGFEKIVLCFDQDKPGQQAVQQVAEMLPVGKVFVMRLERKDANDVLINDGAAPLTQAYWNAVEWRPDGIVRGEDLWKEILETKDAESISYPWKCVNNVTKGLRKGELVTVTAGSGIGKSYFVREIAYHLIQQGETVGMLMLEETTTRTALGLMGLALNRPLHQDKKNVSEEQLRGAFSQTVGCGRLFLYDHFGSTDVDNLLNKVRYMSKALGCSWIILDHLSIVVSGLDGNDERKLIDRAMTMLRTLVQETNIGLLVVSHLRRPEGKGHEEGAQVSLSQLRGSHAIAQLSDMVIGLERNQQAEDATKKDQTTVRILKNRFDGNTGEAGVLLYNGITGRQTECGFGKGSETLGTGGME